jgi:hypothetical protein
MEADKPFDSTALADTILRSSDDVHFYVLGAFLCYVSPTFRDMFSLSRGSATDKNEIKDGHPVIPLSEDRETIHYLLSIIHPYIDEPKLDDSRLLYKVWKMAEKYGMETVVGKLQKHLLGDQWMKDQPHKVFAIAIIGGWKDGAEKAKQTLASWPEIPYSELFEDISGADYYKLLESRSCHASPGEGQADHDENDTSVSAGDNLLVDFTSSAAGTSELFRNSCSKTDIILRTLDGVDFCVSRPFLQLFSSAFDEPFSNATGESKNGKTVVRVTDDSKALRYFLLALHKPMDKLPVENPSLIADICMVARKYRMPIVEARLKEQLSASSTLVQKPLCVYAIATALGWGDVAKSAAKNTLNAPVEKAVTSIPELRRITGADLFRLMDYRIKCTIAACGVLKSSQLHRVYGPDSLASHLIKGGHRNWKSKPTIIPSKGQKSPKVTPQSYGSNDVKKGLDKCPRGSTYTNMFAQAIDVLNSSDETDCWMVSSIAEIFKCCKKVAEAIEQAVDKVVIPPSASPR